MPDLPDQLAAALADRYTIERELGHGGNATVYLTHDLKHDRKVALKVLAPELVLAVRTERFLREIQIAARLSHPHILALYDSGEANGILYYVMPLVDGESLRDRLTRERQLPLEDALRITGDVAAALDHAHGQGVVHRDIKPENILLTRSGEALVADFGIARALTVAGGPSVTDTGIAVGTPAYMSPEQASGSGDVSARSDIYSLGCVLYEMLAGRPPFTGATAQEIMARHALDPIPTVTAARPGVPEPIHRALTKALAKAPVDRFARASDLVAALSAPVTSAGANRWSPGRTAAVVATVLALALGAWWALQGRVGDRRHDATWARSIAIPQLLRLAEDTKWDSAWSLARTAATIIPNDSVMESVWPRIAQRVTIETDPPAALVYRNTYAADDRWDLLGSTPLTQVWLPNQVSRVRFAKDGYDTVEVLIEARRLVARRPDRRTSANYRLYPRNALPRGMVPVRGELSWLQGEFEHLPPVELQDYLIDKYEVTNRRFKEFVLAGGYRDRKYWQEAFVKDGRSLRWEDAMAQLLDRTARPGPATWEAGDYPAGQDDYPVGGVSWYEAAAYARFAGQALPTIYHWYRAAGTPASAWIVPHSNFRDRGPAPIGAYAGISDFGTYDMAGNVREWCSNASGGQRYILGGGWNDGEYMFFRLFAQSPWDRSPTNGLRLVKYLDPADPGAAAARPMVVPRRDFMTERPASDAAFAFYRRLFQYDAIPLQATLDAVDSTTPDWITQQVSFTAGYGNERMAAALFVPRRSRPPYQTVVFFPGAYALSRRSRDQLQIPAIDFIVKSGRAVIYPIYKSTYDRGDNDQRYGVPDASNAYKEHVIMWAKDLKRAIDYAETRSDFDLTHLTYYGASWGGRVAPIMIAVEPRIKVAVLHLAGLPVQRSQPEADAFNYVSRVKVPMLLLSGRYDYVFPLETSALPFFRLLDTPPDRKRHVISEGGHFVPRPQAIRETLDWLDRYQGPVQPLAGTR